MQQGQKRLFIEISYTHPSPISKQKKIHALGIAALEIDLNKLAHTLESTGTPLDEQFFCKNLLYGKENRRWLFNPKKNALEVALLRRCERKSVKKIGANKKAMLYVNGCPEQKRHWKKGFLRRQSYAQVFQDCLHCPFCLKIQYQEELRAYQWAPTLPRRIYCWAKEKKWMEQFLFPANNG